MPQCACSRPVPPYHGLGTAPLHAAGPAGRRPGEETSLNEASDKEQPLREDIRLLGRLLGDTVREQEGADTFETIERIRRSSITFRRDSTRRPARNSNAYSIASAPTTR